jgi:hypothetical protein
MTRSHFTTSPAREKADPAFLTVGCQISGRGGIVGDMEEPMNTAKIPQTDSIEELARFWDTHDVTDFEGQLEEVVEPAFEREEEGRRIPKPSSRRGKQPDQDD